jgi:competence protein ComEC
MRHPFVPVALVYVSGLLVARWCHPPLAGLFIVALSLAGGALVSTRLRPKLLWPLIFFTGWTNLATHTAALSPADLRLVIGDQPELVRLRGTLVATPSQTIHVRAAVESVRSLVFIEAEAVQRNDRWEPARGTVAATVLGVLDASFFTGTTVEVFGVIGPPPRAAAEGLFDYRTYLAWQRVYYQFDTRSTNDWTRLSPPGQPPLTDRFLAWAHRTLARGLPVEDEPLRLLWAMTLGWKTALTDEVSEPFMRTGTMHIFAISGLHIALIAGMLVQLLRVLQLPRGACGVVVIPLIWLYTAVTGWQSSAIRSTIMMSVVVLGWSLRRPGNLLNSLAAAGTIILLWQPEQLFQASFQLSFFVVLALALFLPPIQARLNQLLQTDPLLPRELLPRWRRGLNTVARLCLFNLAVSLAAWLGSMPLIALYFHFVTPVSLLANLVIVPLSSFALAANLGSLACGDWLPWLGDLFNHSAWLWMTAMIRFSEWAQNLPGACFCVRPPGFIGFVAWYGLLIGVLSGWLLAPARRKWFALGLALGAFGLGAGAWWRHGATEITVLSLGGGSAHFVHAPAHGGDLLVDCGSESSAGFVVKPFLRGQGVNRLPCLVVTHGDVRHVDGWRIVFDEFRPRIVATSGARFRSPGYRRLIERLDTEPARWRRLQRGDTIAGWTAMHPEAGGEFAQADDGALVLRGEFNGVRVLLLSDLGKAGQAALLAYGGDLRAEIVIAGLPGRGKPLGEALLAAVRPRVIILSDAEHLVAERATPALCARLAQSGATVLRTGESDSITVKLRAGRWEIRAMDGRCLTGTAIGADSLPAPANQAGLRAR